MEKRRRDEAMKKRSQVPWFESEFPWAIKREKLLAEVEESKETHEINPGDILSSNIMVTEAGQMSGQLVAIPSLKKDPEGAENRKVEVLALVAERLSIDPYDVKTKRKWAYFRCRQNRAQEEAKEKALFIVVQTLSEDREDHLKTVVSLA